jgi:hypothetical protein
LNTICLGIGFASQLPCVSQAVGCQVAAKQRQNIIFDPSPDNPRVRAKPISLLEYDASELAAEGIHLSSSSKLEGQEAVSLRET